MTKRLTVLLLQVGVLLVVLHYGIRFVVWSVRLGWEHGL